MAEKIYLKILLLCTVLFHFEKTIGQDAILGIPKGHTAEVYKPVYSHDGNYLITPSADNTAKVWEVRTGRLLHSLQAHTKLVIYAAFTTDNKTIITAGDNSIIIWDAPTGNLRIHLKHGTIPPVDFNKLPGQTIYTSSLTSVTMSADNKWIASAAKDSTVILWNVQTGKEIKRYKTDASPKEIIFKKDNKQIIVLTENSEVNIWDTDNNTYQKNITPDLKNISKILLSPNHERFLILTNTDGSIITGNIITGKVNLYLSKENRIFSAAWFPDGTKIIGTARDSIFVWEEKTGKKISALGGHSGWVNTATSNLSGSRLLSAGRDQVINVWNPFSNKPILSFTAHRAYINAVIFSPDGKQFVSSSNDGTAMIWDIETGAMMHHLTGAAQEVYFGKISADKNYFLTASGDNLCRVWDLKSGKISNTLKGHSSWIYFTEISKDNKYIVTTATDNTARLWNRETGETLQILKGHTNTINHASFHPSLTQIVTASEDKTARLWDMATGDEKFILNHDQQVKTADFSPDGKKILTTSFDRTAKLWNPLTGKAIATLKGHTGLIRTGSFSPNGKYIATASSDQTAVLWNAEDGGFIKTFSGHNDFVYNIGFDKQSKRLYTASLDSSLKIWDICTGNIINNIVPIGASIKAIIPNEDGTQILTYRDNAFHLTDSLAKPQVSIFFKDSLCLLYTPDGYYMGDKQMIKKLYYKQGLKTFGFDQLDIKFNRPDKVLIALQQKDTLLINAYRKAWEKRIQKLGIDTAFFNASISIPNVEIVNIENISYEQTNKNISLHIKAKDNTFRLDRLNIWVNEVPLFGQNGIPLRQRNMHTLDTLIVIPLSHGRNTIETSIVNANGAESYRTPLRLNYKSIISTIPKTYFVGIGVDEYKDKNQNLQYCRKDIRDLAKALKTKHGKNIIIDTLFNQQVTKDAVIRLKKQLLTSGINDRVIIAYSGHGVLNKDYDYFLGTSAINFEDPSEGGLPYTLLENLLDSIPARKKLLLLDACHSGEVDKVEKEALETTTTAGAKNVILGKMESLKPKLGLQNSFGLMQELFVNVHKGTGASIISAAAGTQFALERGDLENGVFTFSILETMQQFSTMRVSALKDHVGRRVQELTNGAQKPTSRNEPLEVDWDIW